jgi:Cu/Ag efflux pump CusA
MIEREVAGAVDVRIQQVIDYPTLKLRPDRTKMAYSGIDHEDTVKNLMSALNK